MHIFQSLSKHHVINAQLKCSHSLCMFFLWQAWIQQSRTTHYSKENINSIYKFHFFIVMEKVLPIIKLNHFQCDSGFSLPCGLLASKTKMGWNISKQFCRTELKLSNSHFPDQQQSLPDDQMSSSQCYVVKFISANVCCTRVEPVLTGSF